MASGRKSIDRKYPKLEWLLERWARYARTPAYRLGFPTCSAEQMEHINSAMGVDPEPEITEDVEATHREIMRLRARDRDWET